MDATPVRTQEDKPEDLFRRVARKIWRGDFIDLPEAVAIGEIASLLKREFAPWMM